MVWVIAICVLNAIPWLRMTAEALKRIHGTLTVMWLCLIPPSVVFWKNSVPYLVAISVYANLAGSLAAWQGARSEIASGPN